jgi:WD40 repeat protein
MVFRQGHFIDHANLLVTSSSKNHISIWDTTTGEELGTWQSLVETSTSTVLSMYSNEKGELFTINTDALIEKWDLTQLNML